MWNGFVYKNINTDFPNNNKIHKCYFEINHRLVYSVQCIFSSHRWRCSVYDLIELQSTKSSLLFQTADTISIKSHFYQPFHRWCYKLIHRRISGLVNIVHVLLLGLEQIHSLFILHICMYQKNVFMRMNRFVQHICVLCTLLFVELLRSNKEVVHSIGIA